MYKLKKIVFNGRIGFVLGFLRVIFSAAIEVLKTESQKTLINGIVRSDAIDALIIKVLSMLLVFSAGSIMFYITGRIFQRVSFFQCKKMVSNLSEKIQRIKAEHLEISYIGNMEAIYTDIDELGTRMYQMSNNCVNIIHTIILFGMLFLIDKKVVMILSIVNIMFLFCEKLLMKTISKNERKLVEERRALFNISEEGISGFRDIAGYNYIEKYLKHIDGQFEYFLKQVKKGKTYENINYVLAAFFKWLNLILGLSILYFNTSNKDISVGVFFAAYQYINQYSNLICNLGANIKAINSVIVRRNKIQSDINSIDVIDANKGIELNSKIENIEIKNVKFSYPDTNQQMYFNNYIEIGKKNIIIGESGKGKTTFIKLLLKYYTISSGEIIINEMYNLKDIAYESWISKICVVNQEPYIFNDTIKNNITLGRKICDDEIKKVCDCVMLTEYIESLSGGINTMIGENGVNISGGQKQRIAIARALLQKTEIIIMDEALSALDIANQQAIQNNIDQLKKGITQLIITHQLLEQDDAHIIEI